MNFLLAFGVVFVVGLLISSITNTRAEKLVLVELLNGDDFALRLSDRIEAATRRRLWSSTIYPALRSLEDRGLVERRIGNEYGQTRWSITPGGKAIANMWRRDR